MRRGYLLQCLDKWRVDPSLPILLGCSGGADSKALLYLLKDVCKDLHVAHMDHGWRKESSQEAKSLQNEVEGLGITFHLKRQGVVSGNLENEAREARLKFFHRLYHELGAEGLFLGHHADDRAEVALKRLFEGASFSAMGAFSEERCIRGMRVLRPLIPFTKKSLLGWLQEKGISYFEDATNLSQKFLRGRMRTQMVPYLQEVFGKEIVSNLCFVADEAQEIASYFLEMNQPLLEECVNGKVLTLPSILPKLQLSYLVREFLRGQGFYFSRQILQGVVETLLEGGHREFVSGAGRVKVSCKSVSVL